MPRAFDSEPPLSIGSTYAPGDRIAGRYQLLRILDQGGMGVVWVAHHLALDVHVAIKLLRPDAGSENAAARLLLEAQAAARLDHPAILRVLDVGETEAGDPFLVMELLEGECLADVLEREKSLDAITTVRTVLPVADALSALHAKGIFHRDVKPENIFLAQSDSGRWQPKLIDFGVARLEQQAAERITRRGLVVGTPLYMSPEQLRGEETDARSDVWALSVVLYEVMTGELPFDAETNVLLLLALLEAEPRPLAEHGVGDEALWSILRRGLSAKEERWPSVRALGEALAEWLWARGVRLDIAGVGLQRAWLDGRAPAERPRLPAAAPAPPDPAPATPTRPPRAAMTRELVARAPLARTGVVARTTTPGLAPAPPAIERRTSGLVQSITPPPREVRRPPRRLLLGATAAVLGAGLIAAAWLGRAPPVANDKSDAGQPTATPPVSAAPPATTRPVTSASASTAPPATPSGSAPRPATLRPRPRAEPSALPPGLKDPFR